MEGLLEQARQRIADEHFVGKTVVSVDTEAINCLTFHLSDGSRVTIENTDFHPYGDKMVHQLVIRGE